MPLLATPYSRRTLLRAGARTAIAAALASGALPPAAYAIDWQKLFSDQMPMDVNGTVQALEGQAFVNEQPLSVGSKVPSGATVSVVKGGRCVISLEDNTIFTVYGGSSLELLLNKMSQGVLNLVAGALLMVVNTGGAFLVAGSTATFGIKGTVVYRQVFDPQMKMGETMDGLVELPRGYSDYFCTCHGETDFLLSGRSTPYRTRVADYHDAWYLNPADPTAPLRAPMLNHSDEEIRKLVDMQQGPKHDISWLRH